MDFFRVACRMAMLVLVMAGVTPARAVEAINVRTDASAIDLTDAAERHRTDEGRILVSAAPGPDGIIRRMDVRAREGNTNWAVFALANSGDEQIERIIVVPHYRMVGLGHSLARPRPLPRRQHHVERRTPRAAGQRHRRHLPHHARSRRGDDLRA